jgi:hypothetical protein
MDELVVLNKDYERQPTVATGYVLTIGDIPESVYRPV